MHQLSCSIVLFNTEENDLTHAVQSVLQSNLSIELYLVDNSPTNKLKTIAEKFNVNYIFNNKNLGFGAAHNIAIKNALNYSQYHLVLNPDVEFKKGVALNTTLQFGSSYWPGIYYIEAIQENKTRNQY